MRKRIVRKKVEPVEAIPEVKSEVKSEQVTEQVEIKETKVEEPQVEPQVELGWKLNQPNVEEPVNFPQGDTLRTARIINNGPLFPFFIPFDSGENPNLNPNIPVTINGYKWIVKKGEQLLLPKELIDLLNKRLKSEGKLASHPRSIAGNPKLEEFFNS